ncbi:GDSL esterase/lipase At4g10955-like [Salvia hispanica]|uniref:GDSL esterase/lipase At4g10955-like n=1 Tax=Salvia hispanica TaxID=49212 RepID=UPI002009084B|nr:GDSL esterase/lipase At4g10955-like [Salvia hispanica]
MVPDNENFALSGPSFLAAVDWNNSNHKRWVAASLIQGVYVLESDRRNGCGGSPLALAPPWWESFGFDLHEVLTNDRGQYFAAVYVFNSTFCVGQRPPQYVVAFRGKIAKFNGGGAGKVEDLVTTLSCMVKNPKASKSFKLGQKASADVISRVGPGNVWLAGHSNGASLTLLIGRNMVKSHSAHLETYLFNPPFASPPIERIKSEKVKRRLRVASSVFTAGLAVAVKVATGPKTQDDEAFTMLSSWVPNLFVSSSDMICSEYIGYFENRETMEAIGARKIEMMAMTHSIRSIVASSRGRMDSEPVHLLPSAFLTINTGALPNFKEAHGIHQWWNPNLELKYKSYNYN